MESRAFSDGAILRAAWQRVKDRLGFFVLLGIILVLFFVFAAMLIGMVAEQSDWGGAVAQIVYYILCLVIGIGTTKIFLDVADGKQGSLADLFKHWNVLLKYLGVSILYGIVTFVGTILLIFPAVIWGLKFFFAPWLVVDKGMGPIQAMKVSSRMTMNMKWDLLGFLTVVYVAFFIGFLCLGIGMIVTWPLMMLATAMVYRHLLKGVDV